VLFIVPENFHAVLKNYTRKGYRVIAAAYRPLPANINYTKMQRLSREEVEKDLILLGLVVLENKLKPETTPVISKLKNANLRVVIVTGEVFFYSSIRVTAALVVGQVTNGHFSGDI